MRDRAGGAGPRPTVIDCDPGVDDAVALAMAVASPDEIDLLGVTTTYGNVGIGHTTNNALRVLEWLGSEVPVHSGATRSLLSPRVDASQYHGESGLEAPALLQPTRPPASADGIGFLVDTLMSHPEPVTVVATGPLTNVALAIRLEPRIVGRIAELVVMGGSTDFGNDSPAAEFNMMCDPHAAQIVFTSDLPVVMFGLNTTHQVIASPQENAALRAIGNESSAVFADIMATFESLYLDAYGFAGAAMHDPCTIAYLLDPGIFTFRAMHVEVDTTAGISFGRTVHDIWHLSGKPRNVHVAMGADSPRFFELLRRCIARLR
jgi:purine nucleosidase